MCPALSASTKRSRLVRHVRERHPLDLAGEERRSAVELVVEAVDDRLRVDAGPGPLAVGAAQGDRPVRTCWSGTSRPAGRTRSRSPRRRGGPGPRDGRGGLGRLEVDDVDPAAARKGQLAGVVGAVRAVGPWITYRPAAAGLEGTSSTPVRPRARRRGPQPARRPRGAAEARPGKRGALRCRRRWPPRFGRSSTRIV